MSDQNPYSTPDASLANETIGTYDPKFFSPSGRIGRLRYLAYNTAVNLVLTMAVLPMLGTSAFMGSSGDIAGIGMIGGIAIAILYLVSIVLTIMFGKRRLNDLNRSGWYILLFIIPPLNLVLIIYMLFFRGTDGNNKFGQKAVPNTIGVKILGTLIPIVFLLGILTAIGIPAYQDYITRAQQSQ